MKTNALKCSTWRGVRISTFAPTDSGLVLVKERPIPVHALDFCRIRDRYFVVSSKPSNLIHELAGDSLINSFGTVAAQIPKELERHASILRQIAARGRLYCADDPPLIVHFPEATPVIQAFTSEGQLRWSTTLPNYHKVRHEPFNGGRGIRMAPDPTSGTAHSGQFLTPLGDGTIAITLRENSLANIEGTLELRILSLADGRQLSVSRASDILVARHRDRDYSFVQYPYPQVRDFANGSR